ncbi:hypothetical protein BTVI_127732 [Pitangus sulphuratus]|nr:hypothetical protein BTVI_127732 [Pitangus sulphuratus]
MGLQSLFELDMCGQFSSATKLEGQNMCLSPSVGLAGLWKGREDGGSSAQTKYLERMPIKQPALKMSLFADVQKRASTSKKTDKAVPKGCQRIPVKPSTGLIEGQDHIVGNAIPKAPQDTTGLLGHKGTLLAHGQFVVYQHPQAYVPTQTKTTSGQRLPLPACGRAHMGYVSLLQTERDGKDEW